MGSGCTSSSSGGGFFGKRTPDKGVQYTGPAIPKLGICTGDSLDEIEAVILTKLLQFMEGKGIFIADIDLTACALFVTEITCCDGSGDTPKELDFLIQAIFRALCTLYTDLADVKTKLTDLLTGPYYTSCLTGLPANPTLRQILQALLIEFCALKASVAALQIQVNTLSTSLTTNIGNFLLSAITTCTGANSVIKSGAGASASIAFKGFPPVGGIMMLDPARVGDYDSGGLGKPNTSACGWALADGRNGTVNMIGLVPVGTTDMTGTPPISGATLPANSTGGEYFHTLTASECGVAAHTHTVIEPNGGQGHSHTMSVNLDTASGSNNSNYMKFDTTSYTNTKDGDPDVGNIHAKIRYGTTGITLGSAAQPASSAHENRMPYRALYYIQRIN